MNIYHIVSRYPTLSESFIVREINQLGDEGDESVICRLKWPKMSSESNNLTAEDAIVMPYQTSPIYWIKGLVWVISTKRGKFRDIIRDVYESSASLMQLLKITVIILNLVGAARLIDNKEKYPEPEHIRSYFLGSTALSAMWMSELLDVGYSITAYTSNIWISEYLVRGAIERADFCVVTTKETKEMIEKNYNSSSIVMSRQGVRLDRLDAIAWPFKPGSYEGTINILAIGRIVEKKGFDILISACSLLSERGINYKCKILGRGPIMDTLQKKISEKRLNNEIVMEGAVPFDTVKKELEKAFLLAMPSRESDDGSRDGLPTVVIEAMGLGVPVVATRFAGITDLVVHGVTGRLCRPNNPDRLAEQIIQAIENRCETKRMAKKARKVISKQYNLKKEVRKVKKQINNKLT